jgi:uncharacterized membrane protein YgcG
VLTSILLSGALAATTVFPAPHGPVADDAQLVPSAVERRVEEGLLEFQERAGVAISFAVVESIAPLAPDEYARQLGEAWGATNVFDLRAVVVVIATASDAVGIAVSDALEPELSRASRKEVLDASVRPRVARGDVADAVEVGAIELRRVLGDTTVPPPVATTAPPRAQPTNDDDQPWGWTSVGAVVIAVLAATLVVVRRRRTWGHRSPVLWGAGWGRPVEDPRAAVHRRYRRVRDAVHVAEAETGMPLCFWLGPVTGDEIGPLADALFAEAVADGHAAALVMVAVRRPYVEVRVAPWAHDRLDRVATDDLVDLPKVEALLTAAGRIAAGGAPPATAPGGIGRPPSR